MWTSVASAQTEPQGYPTLSYPVPTPEPGSTVVSSRTVALLRVLDVDLDRLAERSDGRVLDGTLQIVVGGVFVGLGVLIEGELFRSIMFLSGGVSLARGINRLTLEPDAGDLALEFHHMPALNGAQVAAKLRYGEASLQHLAARSRAARLVDGSLTMFGSAGYVPLYWGLRRKNDPDYRFGDDAFDYVGLALSAVGFTAGLITVIRKSHAERSARSYRELKERFVAESPEEFSFVPRVGVALGRTSLGGSATWQF
jgi:hypothetical protein